MVFLWFSYGFPKVFLRFSSGFLRELLPQVMSQGPPPGTLVKIQSKPPSTPVFDFQALAALALLKKTNYLRRVFGSIPGTMGFNPRPPQPGYF